MSAESLRGWPILVLACAVSTLAASSLRQHAPDGVRCPAEVTAEGGGYYLVRRGDTVVSRHLQEREAVVRAILEESRQPAADVWIVHDYRVRVECPEDWAPVVVDSLAVRPSGFDLLLGADGDTTIVARWRGRPIDTVTSVADVSRALLVYANGGLWGCGGPCDFMPPGLARLDRERAERLAREWARSRAGGGT